MCVFNYIHIHMYTCACMYIYLYIYIQYIMEKHVIVIEMSVVL